MADRLDSYFARIGYEGPRQNTLSVLYELHRLHTAAIAFENLTPFLGETVHLDSDNVDLKLVNTRRGGYCFEHSILFANVLRALNFEIAGLSARTLWGLPAGTVSARGHSLLRVEVGGMTYLCDVGFGGRTPTCPLLLQPDVIQASTHDTFVLRRDQADFVLSASVAGTWRPLYRFDETVALQSDFEMANYFVSTHPSSPFRQRLMAARPTDDGRWTLANCTLSFHRRNGCSENRQLTSVDALERALDEIFLVDPPDGLAAQWQRLAACP